MLDQNVDQDFPKNPTPQEYFQGFPEAPFSDTFKWIDEDGFEHMTTIRSWSSKSGLQAVGKAKDEVKALNGTTANSKAPQTQKAPAPASAPAIQAVVGNLPVVDTSVNTMEIVKVKVEPQADGKIKVALFGQGHKFADLYMTLGLDATLKALANTGYEWTAEYLNKIAEYDMHFYADWRNSEKLNSKGNPYKNIVTLRPLDAVA